MLINENIRHLWVDECLLSICCACSTCFAFRICHILWRILISLLCIASLYENIPFCVHLQKSAISKQIEIYTHCSLCLCLSVCITLQYCHHWSSIECIELSIKLFIRLMKSHFNWHWTFAIRPIAQNWDVPNRNPEEDDWRAKRDENSIFELCLWWNSRHLIVNQFL